MTVRAIGRALAKGVRVVVVALTGCVGLGGPDEVPELAVIELDDDAFPLHVVAPVRASPWEAFDIEIRSYFGGCWREGPTRRSVDGLSARLEPLDLRPRVASFCPDVLRTATRSVRLRFTTSGVATIVIRGLSSDRISGAVEGRGDTIEVVRTVRIE